MKKVAVVTMQYNEAFYVSRWIEYYSGLVGRENLYVVDASAIPEIPSANTNLTTVALAEQVAGWL